MRATSLRMHAVWATKGFCQKRNVFPLLWKYQRLDEHERNQGTTSQISESPRPGGRGFR